MEELKLDDCLNLSPMPPISAAYFYKLYDFGEVSQICSTLTNSPVKWPVVSFIPTLQGWNDEKWNNVHEQAQLDLSSIL